MAKAAKAPTVRDEEKALGQRWRTVDIASLTVPDTSWTYDDAQTALKLQASLKRHGQFRAVVCYTPPDGSTVVVKGRRLLAAMRAVGLTRAMVCDLGDFADDERVMAVRLAHELRFEVDYARVAQAVHAYMATGVTADRLASAGPFTAERIGYFNTLATFDWAQFSEAAESDGQTAMDWDAEDLPPPHAPAASVAVPPPRVPPPEQAELLGPDSFGGTDEGSHYMAQTKAADLAPAVALAKGKPKKAVPPGPSLFDGMDEA